MTTKVCTKCGVEKPLGEYYKKKDCRYGVNSVCKVCRSKEANLYYENNKVKSKERTTRWRQENPERDRESYRRRVNNNPEKERERYRIWVNNNPEKAREKGRRSRNRLMPSYVKSKIRRQYNIDTANITPETIEMKRRNLKYYRELNQLKKITK